MLIISNFLDFPTVLNKISDLFLLNAVVHTPMSGVPIERRLAAIMAADVVGYSRLMGQDEAGTLTAIKAWRNDVLEPLINRHRGRIFKVIGDGALVEFGSAVNAVQCAIELQEMMTRQRRLPEDRQIVLRIGINLGDVMVEGSDLYGDGINIAARLEGIAEPGGCLVSGTVFDYVRNKVNAGFEDLGDPSLKNIAEPVRVYRISGTPRVADRTERTIRQAFHRGTTVHQHERRSGAGVFRRRNSRGYHHRAGPLAPEPKHVLSRNTSFRYRGQDWWMRRVSAANSAFSYVVEGSVRQIGRAASASPLSSSTRTTGSHPLGGALSIAA